MTDIVKRLRDLIITGHNPDGPPSIKYHPPIADEAADEIERLRAALRRLLATINPGNAAEHSPECGCVIHEARRALQQREVP